MIPGLLLIFLHGCEIKSGSGLGMRLHPCTAQCMHMASFPGSPLFSPGLGMRLILALVYQVPLGQQQSSQFQLRMGDIFFSLTLSVNTASQDSPSEMRVSVTV